MKLLTRTTLLYVLITLVVFAIGSVVFYSYLRKQVDEETIEGLYNKKASVLAALQLNDSTISNSPLAEDVNIEQWQHAVTIYLRDTTLFDPLEDEYQPYKLLTFPYQKEYTKYKITIKKIMIESDDLIEGVFISFLIILGLLAASVLTAFQLLSKRIWKPFILTLEQLKSYQPEGKSGLLLPATRIKEFSELNSAITLMAKNTEDAFATLKAFSENAAHEIQTPLAVITSTAEVLLQDESLSESQHELISKLHLTARKLSSLTSTLLLLTKIENRQFEHNSPIDFSQVVLQKIELLQELFDQKKNRITSKVENNVMLKIHPVLGEIIVSNLLANALQHTLEGGSVRVSLTKDALTISNSGAPLKAKSNQLFERFYKENQSEKSTGLGLTLVKMAAESAHYRIEYQFIDENHVFSVKF